MFLQPLATGFSFRLARCWWALGAAGTLSPVLWAKLGTLAPPAPLPFALGGLCAWLALVLAPKRRYAGHYLPGALGTALLVLPPLIGGLCVERPWLALLGGAGHTALVLSLWRRPLTTGRSSPRARLTLLVAALLTGAMGAVLVSPRALDARGLVEEVVASDISRFQRILVTRLRDSLRLYIDGQRQFSSESEAAYHEALVRPAMSHRPERVLVLGGGDGFAGREVLAHPFVRCVVVVELDAQVTRSVTAIDVLAKLTDGAFTNPRLTLVHDDALHYLETTATKFDAIVADFPDPTSAELSRLYTTDAYALMRARLAPGGVVVTQASSAASPGTVEAIQRNLTAAGFFVRTWQERAASPSRNASLLSNVFSLGSRAPFEIGTATLHTPAKTLPDSEALRSMLSAANAG